MQLTYEAGLDDVTEPSARHYLRSETARKTRIRSTVIGGILWATALLFIFRRYSSPAMEFAACLGLMFGASLNYFTFTPTLRRRLRKHMERETQGRIPAPTIYRFEDGRLVCESLGILTSFPSSELEDISENGGYMEISFGKIGLCTIPLRAFESSDHKETFIRHLKPNDRMVTEHEHRNSHRSE